MTKKILKLARLALCFIAFNVISFVKPHHLVESANLTSAKDTLDTSRSSWKTLLDGATSAAATSFKLDSLNGILPGDVIKLWEGTAETLIIATVDTTSSRVTTTTAAANGHADNGDVTGGFGYDPVTDVGGTIAYHEITFMPGSSAINGGEVRITLPNNNGNANDGEPDTDGFDFNSMGGVGGSSPEDDIYCYGGGTALWGTTGKTASASATTTTGDIVIPFRGTLSNETVTCNIGQTARGSGVHLINPAKTLAVGTADSWTVKVETRSFPDYPVVDTIDLKVATVESVRVTATINPTLSVIIAGTANATSVCGETTNSGSASTAVLVPLGTMADDTQNINAQSVSIATNGRDGYTLLIKDDGYLRKSNGDNIDYWRILTANDTPAPLELTTTGSEAYGVHVCGTYVNQSIWGDGAASVTNHYGAPGSGTAWQYYRTLSSSTAALSATKTNVVYKATIAGTTPAGEYAQAVTYTATGNF